MLKRMKMLTNKSSILLYVQGGSKPIIIVPQQSAMWYYLLSKLKSSTPAIPLQVSQLTLPTEGLSQIPAENQNKQIKLYLDQSGKIREGIEYENAVMHLGTLSGKIDNKKIIGIQQKWQYMLGIFCKFVIVASVVSIFRYIYLESRLENKNKYKQLLK